VIICDPHTLVERPNITYNEDRDEESDEESDDVTPDGSLTPDAKRCRDERRANMAKNKHCSYKGIRIMFAIKIINEARAKRTSATVIARVKAKRTKVSDVKKRARKRERKAELAKKVG
jgi:hypothetical protein